MSAQFWLGSAYTQEKRYAQAVETFQRARQLSGDAPVMLMAYGYAQAFAGNPPEARSALLKLQQLRSSRFVPSLYPAAIHVALGETDEAARLVFSWRERRRTARCFVLRCCLASESNRFADRVRRPDYCPAAPGSR